MWVEIVIGVVVLLALAVFLVVAMIGGWLAWWMVRIKDHPHTILIDCRDEDCENNACIVVRYIDGSVDLKMHGSTMSVVQAWRLAIAKGIVDMEVTA